MVKAFHAQKEMKIPLHAAVISFAVNLILSLVLMKDFGMFGLAWANVFSAFVQTIYLAVKLDFFDLKSLFLNSVFSFPCIMISSLSMLFTLWFLKQEEFLGTAKFSGIAELLVMIPLGVVVYGITLSILGFPEFDKIRERISAWTFKKK
jgi:putative peptidoglycan lipid II flippase